MATTVQICNLALARVGEVRGITSLTDGTEAANLCNLLYTDIAEEVMGEGEWTCCISRDTLVKTINTPDHEFGSEYQLPTNPRILKLINVYNERVLELKYTVEGDKLYTNEGEVSIKYIGFLEDTSAYTTYLKSAIVSRLAHELSYVLTGSTANSERLYARYELDLRKGLTHDRSQGSKTDIRIYDIIRNR